MAKALSVTVGSAGAALRAPRVGGGGSSSQDNRGRMLGQRKASGRRISMPGNAGSADPSARVPGLGPQSGPLLLGQCQADGGHTGEQACVASCGQAGKQQVTQLLLSRVGRDQGGGLCMLLFGPGSWVSFGGWGTVEWPCVWCSPIPIPNVCGNAQLQSHWPTVSVIFCCTAVH